MVSLISQERETTLQVEGRIPAVWSQRITDGSVLSAWCSWSLDGRRGKKLKQAKNRDYWA